MKLYELADSFAQVSALMEEGYEGLEDTLESIQLTFNQKVESIVKLRRGKEVEAEAIKAEMDRLEKRLSKLYKDIDWLTGYAENQMLKVGVVEVKSDLFKISLRMSPPRVEIQAGASLPVAYIKRKISESPDKISLKKAIESGEEIPGVSLVQEMRLQVK